MLPSRSDGTGLSVQDAIPVMVVCGEMRNDGGRSNVLA
jgi:hypothetical protein